MTAGHDGDGLDNLVEVVARLDVARVAVNDLLDQRDSEIRRLLASGVPYARLGAVTGLSRAALDTVRRGQRHRH